MSNKNEEVGSFLHAASKNPVVASIKVTASPTRFRKLVSKKNFDASLSLERDPRDPMFPKYWYRIVLQKDSFRSDLELSPDYFIGVSIESDNKMKIDFNHPNVPETASFEIVFEFQEKFEYFKKVFEGIKKLHSKEEEDEIEIKAKENIGIGCNPVYEIEKDEGGSLGVSSISGRRGKKKGNAVADFFKTKCDSWRPNHIIEWLKFCQIEEKDEKGEKTIGVITICDYITRKNLRDELMRYFAETHDATLSVLNKHIIKYNSTAENEINATFPNHSLRMILADEPLRLALAREISFVKNFNEYYPVDFGAVLKKRLWKKKVEDIINGETTLNTVIEDTRTSYRYCWDVAANRDHVLSLLLFRDTFDTYIEKKVDEFKELEEKEFLGVKESISYDSKKWSALYHKLCLDCKINLRTFNFEMKCKYEQNEVRKKRNKSKQKLILKMKQEARGGGCKEIVEKIKRLRNNLKELESDRKKNRIKIKIVSKKVDRLTKEFEELKLEEKKEEEEEEEDGEFEIDESKIKPKKSEFEKWDFYRERSYDDDIYKIKLAFEKSYQSKARKFLRNELQNQSKVRLAEFTVKLVSSVKSGSKLGLMGLGLGIINRFKAPQCTKFGPVHSGVQVANIGFHWNTSSLCAICNLHWNDSYEEIYALDAYAPLFATIKSSYSKLTELSRIIVEANVNKTYAEFNVGTKGTDFINCQEFSMNILKALDSTQFPAVVKEYYRDIRKILSDKVIQDAHNSRFIKINNEFKKMYGKVWKDNPKFKPKQGKIYFNRHIDLDEFCVALNGLYSGVSFLERKFPGYFQLLKGFDRAFWMRSEKENASPLYEIDRDGKSICKCPFNLSHVDEKDFSILVRTELLVDDLKAKLDQKNRERRKKNC